MRRCVLTGDVLLQLVKLGGRQFLPVERHVVVVSSIRHGIRTLQNTKETRVVRLNETQKLREEGSQRDSVLGKSFPGLQCDRDDTEVKVGLRVWTQ